MRLDRFLARRWTGAFLPALGVLLAVYLGGEVATRVWPLLQEGIPAGRIAAHFLLKLPLIFYTMAPVAALLATLLTLTALKKSGELGAMFFSGVRPWDVVRPLALCALLVTAFTFAINQRLVGAANRASEELVRSNRSGAPTLVGTRGIWLIEGNRILHIRSVEGEGTVLLDPTILTFTGTDFTRLAERMDGEKAVWSGESWRLSGAWTRRFEADSPLPPSGPEEVTLSLGVRPDKFFKVQRWPDEMGQKELAEYIRDLRLTGLPSARHAVRWHRNLAVSLLPLALALVAITVAFRIPLRGGVPVGTAAGLLILLAFWSLYSFTLSLGGTGTIHPALAAWGMPLLLTVAGALSIALSPRVRLN